MKFECDRMKGFAPLILRIGLGTIFVYHGFGKVFGEGTALGSAWNPHGMPALMQVLVAWGEFIGGLALFAGFLTPFAALGISIIMIGAIIVVHGKNGFNMMNHGYEYNFALLMMCLALIASGPGSPSLDQKCCCSKKE